jgi:hypothetical protein
MSIFKAVIRIIAALLVLSSAPCLLYMAAEAWATSQASRYSLEHTRTTHPGFSAYALEEALGEHRIELRDDLRQAQSPESARVISTVTIRVNGSDLSSTALAVVRPHYPDSNRYHSWVALVRITDRETHSTRLAVVQRIAPPPVGDWDNPAKAALRFRLVLLDAKGHTTEESFSYAERASPRYRALLATQVSPYGLGFYSEVFQVWPSILYPIAYPAGTSLLGLALIILFRRKARS